MVLGKIESGDMKYAVNNHWNYCELGTAARPELVREAVFLVFCDRETDVEHAFNIFRHYKRKWVCFIVPDAELIKTIQENYTDSIHHKIAGVIYTPGESKKEIIRRVKLSMPIWLRYRRLI